jgi:multiple sugar transport system permease protein
MVDGCNAVQAVVFVVIPMAIVGLLSIGILVFVGCWNEFLFASTLAGMNMKTLPVAALMFIRDEAILWGPMTATCVIIMFIPIVITIFLQKYIVSGISLGALKG